VVIGSITRVDYEWWKIGESVRRAGSVVGRFGKVVGLAKPEQGVEGAREECSSNILSRLSPLKEQDYQLEAG
jgi:hypothetical protein